MKFAPSNVDRGRRTIVQTTSVSSRCASTLRIKVTCSETAKSRVEAYSALDVACVTRQRSLAASVQSRETPIGTCRIQRTSSVPRKCKKRSGRRPARRTPQYSHGLGRYAYRQRQQAICDSGGDGEDGEWIVGFRSTIQCGWKRFWRSDADTWIKANRH